MFDMMVNLSIIGVIGQYLSPAGQNQMKLFYITLNNVAEAKAISMNLLEKKLALCTNWFPIGCAYRWQGEIKQGDEVVLIVKTKEAMREQIEEVITSMITYTNFIAEINVQSINDGFSNWLNEELTK